MTRRYHVETTTSGWHLVVDGLHNIVDDAHTDRGAAQAHADELEAEAVAATHRAITPDGLVRP